MRILAAKLGIPLPDACKEAGCSFSDYDHAYEYLNQAAQV